MQPLLVDKVYVVHVRSNKERERHMINELGAKDISFEFMNDGDIPDLTQALLDEYLSGEMSNKIGPEQSCAIKHLKIYERMIENNVARALILEDDVFLSDGFVEAANQVIQEWSQIEDANHALINLEASALNLVPNKERVEGKFIYSAKSGRCAGAYLMSLELAKSIIEEVKKNGCHQPIDWYHNHLANQGILSHYWSHPTIVVQGSHSGQMDSLIDHKKKGLFQQLLWKAGRWYKNKIQ